MRETLYESVDRVYVINLRRRTDRRQRMRHQLLTCEGKTTWIDAYDTRLPEHQTEYHQAIERLRFLYSTEEFERFIRWTFQRGAFGCLKSHLACIQDAQRHGYQTILILEDDALALDSLDTEWGQISENIPTDWQLLYLGKKQGDSRLESVNADWYHVNSTTWASHAWMVNHNIFGCLVEHYTQYDNSVDNMVKDLARNRPIYAVKRDLFITGYESDIRRHLDSEQLRHYQKWGWDPAQYYNGERLWQIRQVVVWGFAPGERPDHTHTYIHRNIARAFRSFLPHLPVYHLPDQPLESDDNDGDYTLYFVSPTHGCASHLPLTSHSLYIIHTDNDPSNLGESNSEIQTRFRPVVTEGRGLYLHCRYPPYGFDRAKRILRLPWAANMATDNSDRDGNAYGDYRFMLQRYYQAARARPINRDNLCLVYFGSVWSENIEVISALNQLCLKRDLPLSIIGRVPPDYYRRLTRENNTVTVTPYAKYRSSDGYESVLDGIGGDAVVLSIQGDQHLGTYLSCRLFSNIAHGYLGVTNNDAVQYALSEGVAVCNRDLESLVDQAVTLATSRLTEYRVRLQQQITEVMMQNTYLNRVYEYLNALERIGDHSLVAIPRSTQKLNRQYLLILSFQRSGSSVLMDMMDNFSNICGLQEIFQGGKVGLNSQLVDAIRQGKPEYSELSSDEIMRHRELVEFRDAGHYTDLLQYIEQHTSQPYLAFKIFPDNMLQLSYVLEMATDPKFIPVVLTRDFESVYTSYQLARKTGSYADRDYRDVTIRFDRESFEPLAHLYSQWYSSLSDTFERTGTQYYVLDYGEDLADNTVAYQRLSRLFNNIGVNAGEVGDRPVRSRQGSLCWTDRVENLEEMQQFIYHQPIGQLPRFSKSGRGSEGGSMPPFSNSIEWHGGPIESNQQPGGHSDPVLPYDPDDSSDVASQTESENQSETSEPEVNEPTILGRIWNLVSGVFRNIIGTLASFWS